MGIGAVVGAAQLNPLCQEAHCLRRSPEAVDAADDNDEHRDRPPSEPLSLLASSAIASCIWKLTYIWEKISIAYLDKKSKVLMN